jgi:hypothetical protein
MGPYTTGSRETWGSWLQKHQHVLCHHLCQSTTLRLQVLADGLLQLQYLGPCDVKQREHGAHLPNWVPGAEQTEAKGHQCSLGLAQKVPDFLCLDCLSRLELL